MAPQLERVREIIPQFLRVSVFNSLAVERRFCGLLSTKYLAVRAEPEMPSEESEH